MSRRAIDHETLRARVNDLRQMWHDATFGPWSANGAIVTGRTPDGDPCRVADCRTSNREHDEDNAAAIAAMFNALPSLLGAIDDAHQPGTGRDDVRDLLRDLDRLLRDHHQRDHAQANDSAHYRARIASVLDESPPPASTDAPENGEHPALVAHGNLHTRALLAILRATHMHKRDGYHETTCDACADMYAAARFVYGSAAGAPPTWWTEKSPTLATPGIPCRTTAQRFVEALRRFVTERDMPLDALTFAVEESFEEVFGKPAASATRLPRDLVERVKAGTISDSAAALRLALSPPPASTEGRACSRCQRGEPCGDAPASTDALTDEERATVDELRSIVAFVGNDRSMAARMLAIVDRLSSPPASAPKGGEHDGGAR